MHKFLLLPYFLFLIPHSLYTMEKEPDKISSTQEKNTKKPEIFTRSAPTKSVPEPKKKPTRTTQVRSHSPQRVAPKMIDPSVSPKSSPRKSLKDYSLKPSHKLLSSSGDVKCSEISTEPTAFLAIAQAIRKGNIELIKTFLADTGSNVNDQDQDRQNTFLHLAAVNHNEPIALLFLLDPRTNSLIRNADHYAPYQFITGNDVYTCGDLYQALLQRARLDHIVDALLMTYPELMETKDSDNSIFIAKIGSLLAKFPQGILPCYGDSQFICAMIKSRVQSDLPILQITRDIYMAQPKYKDEWGITSTDRHAYLHDYDFLDNPTNNPNQLCIDTGNNFLHDMISACNEPIIALLLTNPYIQTLAKNRNGYTAYKCMSKDAILQYPVLYKMLEERIRLDRIVTALMVTNKKMIDTKCNDKTINKKIKKLLARLSHRIIPNYADATFISKMVSAHRLYNLGVLAKMYDNYMKELNYQDPESGYTLVHQLVTLRDKKALKKLFANPAVKSLLRDNDGCFPQALLSTSEKNSEEIRMIVFARDSLEGYIAKALENLLFTHPTINASTLQLSDKCVQDTIKKIKSFAKQTQRRQGDSELPSEVDIPSDVTDGFLLKAIAARIAERKPTTNPMIYFTHPIDILTFLPSSPKKEQTPEEQVMNAIDEYATPQLQDEKESEENKETQSSLLEFLTKN